MKPAVQVLGLPEVNRHLRRLAGPEGKKAIRRGMRAAMKPLVPAVSAALPLGETGELRRSPKLKAGRSRKGSLSLRVVIGKDSFQGRWHGSFRDLGTGKLAGSHAMRGVFESRGDATRAEGERAILAEVLKEARK